MALPLEPLSQVPSKMERLIPIYNPPHSQSASASGWMLPSGIRRHRPYSLALPVGSKGLQA